MEETRPCCGKDLLFVGGGSFTFDELLAAERRVLSVLSAEVQPCTADLLVEEATALLEEEQREYARCDGGPFCLWWLGEVT